MEGVMLGRVWVLAAMLGAATGAGAQSVVADCAVQTESAPPDPVIAKMVQSVDTLLRINQVDQARTLIELDLRFKPENSVLEAAKARVLYRDGDLAGAVAAENLALRLDRCNWRAHYEAWRVEATAGDWTQAQKQLEVTHALAPKNELVTRMWANSHAKLPEGVVLDRPPVFGFYARHVDCDGVTVRAAAVVNPEALLGACRLMTKMMEHMPNVRANMVARGAEMHLTGEDQKLSDLPEYRQERGERTYVPEGKPTAAKVDVDTRAAATGGIYANCMEANVLHMEHDWAGTQNEICVHEFAHDLMGTGFDDSMRAEIEKQYNASMKKGLWKGAYAATNRNEWWAEISVWYFGGEGDTHAMVGVRPGMGADSLKWYDPEAFALADKMYSGRKKPRVVKEHDVEFVHEMGPGTGPNPSEGELLLVNNRGTRQYLYWLDSTGHAHEQAKLEPFTRQMQRCWVGSNWMLVDPRTKERTMFVVTDEDARAVFGEVVGK